MVTLTCVMDETMRPAYARIFRHLGGSRIEWNDGPDRLRLDDWRDIDQIAAGCWFWLTVPAEGLEELVAMAEEHELPEFDGLRTVYRVVEDELYAQGAYDA